MKTGVIKLDYGEDADTIFEVLLNHVYDTYSNVYSLSALIDDFSIRNNVVHILGGYDSYKDGSLGGYDSKPVEWVKVGIYENKYIISAYDQVFKGFKLKFNRSKGGVIIYYVYVESGYLNKNLKYRDD